MKDNRTILIALGLVCLVVTVTSLLYFAERRRQEAVREAVQQMLDLESSALEARSSGDLEITLYLYRPSATLDHLDAQTSDEFSEITVQKIPVQEIPAAADPGPANAWVAMVNSENAEVLIWETRSIFRTDDIILTARQIIHEVLKGPSDGEFQIFAPEARLRQVFLLEDGTALVDLSRQVVHPLLGGIAVELSALYSVTRSLRENIESISRVRFLVEGQERPTLAGHVSIREPFM
jgi:predicted RNA binding protein with dsRBD fold (UPF0201 family)